MADRRVLLQAERAKAIAAISAWEYQISRAKYLVARIDGAMAEMDFLSEDN